MRHFAWRHRPQVVDACQKPPLPLALLANSVMRPQKTRTLRLATTSCSCGLRISTGDQAWLPSLNGTRTAGLPQGRDGSRFFCNSRKKSAWCQTFCVRAVVSMTRIKLGACPQAWFGGKIILLNPEHPTGKTGFCKHFKEAFVHNAERFFSAPAGRLEIEGYARLGCPGASCS